MIHMMYIADKHDAKYYRLPEEWLTDIQNTSYKQWSFEAQPRFCEYNISISAISFFLNMTDNCQKIMYEQHYIMLITLIYY